MIHLRFVLIFIYLIFLGCAESIIGYENQLTRYDTIYNQKLCNDEFIHEQIDSKDDEILWTQLAGSLKRQCKDYKSSNLYFDLSEEYYKSEVDLENIGEKSLNAVGSILTNDNSIDYKGNIYEAIMVNTYKGLNFLSLGDFNNARVEFNRALDRQRRAKNEFHEEIENRRKQIQKESNNQQINESKSEDFVLKHYSEGVFKNFRAYPDFINPFVTYISALFFMSTKDYLKARDLLKEGFAMDPKNKSIKDDFYLVSQILSKKGIKDKYVWIIYENGKSTTKNEFRLDLPIFLVSNKVLYTGVSFPTLKPQNSSYEYLKVNKNRTILISDMDRVVKTEFKTKLPYIITKTVARSISKTVAQAELSKKEPIAGVAMALFSAITNKSDIRSWTSLPKNFQATRVKNIGKPITIKTDTEEILQNFTFPKNKNAIIIISSPQKERFTIHEILY